MIQQLTVGMKDLKKQLDLVDARVDYLAGCKHGDPEAQEECDLLDGLANFLSALNEALEEVEVGQSVAVYRGKEKAP
jgi:hypothetical protein